MVLSFSPYSKPDDSRMTTYVNIYLYGMVTAGAAISIIITMYRLE